MRQEKTREALALILSQGAVGETKRDALAEIAEWENHRARADRIEAAARAFTEHATSLTPSEDWFPEHDRRFDALAAALGEGQDSRPPTTEEWLEWADENLSPSQAKNMRRAARAHPWLTLCPACKGYPGEVHPDDGTCWGQDSDLAERLASNATELSESVQTRPCCNDPADCGEDCQ